MFEYLNGKLVKISPTNIVVDLGGVGYLVSVANPYAWSSLLQTEVKIFVHQVIREDAHTLYGFVNEAEKLLRDYKINLKVAIMGCVVNGPGEAKEADIGIAGGDGVGLLFKKGKIIAKVEENKLLDELIKEIDKM